MSNKRNAKQPKGTPELLNNRDILSLPGDEFLSRFGASVAGLTTEGAASRQETYGRNEVVQRAKRSPVIEFLSHFRSPVTIILIVAAIISGFLDNAPSAVIILSIV